MGLYQIDKEIERLIQRKSHTLELLKSNGYNISDIYDKQEAEDEKNFKNFNLNAKSLKQLRVACIMDAFSLNSYRPECILFELTPDNWKIEIKDFKPDILFVESAWEGKDKLWHGKIVKCAKEFFDLAVYCRENAIPVVFWNKEDPVYTDSFMPAAHLADFVFTTDIDCISKYKSSLGHDRVYHLHFAAQPLIHNPIEKYERKNKFCFAGAYYHRYKERSKVFDCFADVFEKFEKTDGFDIYDRNYENARPEHAFPKRYEKNIIGNLAPEDIDKAYKGYMYSVNMNSIQQSQTMFARRAFEVLASNSVTIGNYSRGLRNYLGDLTICTDDVSTLEQYMNRYCADKTVLAKYRLAGLRKVLAEHLYEDRLDYVVQKVFNQKLKPELPSVTVLCGVDSQDEMNNMLSVIQKQTYKNCEIIFIGDNLTADNAKVISKNEASQQLIGDIIKTDFVAVMKKSDYYGKNYLLDLILTTRYGDYDVIGKSKYYYSADKTKNDSVKLTDSGETYKQVNMLSPCRSVAKTDFARGKTLEWLFCNEWSGENMFSADIFNYCENYAGECAYVNDLEISNTGIPIERIYNQSEKIKGNMIPFGSVVMQAADMFKTSQKLPPEIKLSFKSQELLITSTFAPDKFGYIYAPGFVDIKNIQLDGGKMNFQVSGTSDIEIICACIFYNASGEKLESAFSPLNKKSLITLPESSAKFSIALRVKGTGTAQINRMTIGGQSADNTEGNCYLARSSVLVLTNQYPEPSNLYRNMFVHRRVMGYKEDNMCCEVMRMNIYSKEQFYEFESINVTEGQTEVLKRILDSGEIKTVCVHFLDSVMWSVLKEYIEKIRVIVWLHGAEIQPWWRRTFNYANNAELERGKASTEKLQEFWNEVFAAIDNKNLHFVFVSQYFADEVMEDYKVSLPQNSYSVIHNFIDTELFEYQNKTEDKRSKILSIKPYASRKYANDITTNAIVELSKNDIFRKLEFYLYGDGEMFDDDNAPLKRFKNVHLYKKFLSQREIADLHKNCGIFIATTRWDSHGVSRDEAMSSGLVTVANAVSAIPEFVDKNCGMLVPEEDYKGVAEAIAKLYNDPDLFLKLSGAASERVRRQSSRKQTIEKEEQLIWGI